MPAGIAFSRHRFAKPSSTDTTSLFWYRYSQAILLDCLNIQQATRTHQHIKQLRQPSIEDSY